MESENLDERILMEGREGKGETYSYYLPTDQGGWIAAVAKELGISQGQVMTAVIKLAKQHASARLYRLPPIDRPRRSKRVP